ncbi:enoyl-CoA hydratase [Longimonas halophila]|uniref:Enoyl-CoA hydratase n=1 Tax=Longimonas halophila TaxID=1469170 RepID=A0A2H3NLI2_9BACT|nr:enoyl-CoA hydratase-related protein [Longimonas halophila]PEN06709.1 enoyl-CoA hydratase [Longimonas halophila]
MSTPPIVNVSVDAHVATLEMNRPDRRNALSPEMDAALRNAFADVTARDDVRAVLLKAAGSTFCAGADLQFLRPTPDPEEIQRHVLDRYAPLVRQIIEAPLPVVAALNGSTAGAGLALALACDLRLMADDGVLVAGFSSIGFVPDSGVAYFLVRHLGYARAFEMLALSEPVPATQCATWGLVNRVVEADELHTTAQSLAHRLAARPTKALGWTKTCLRHAQTHSLDRTIEHEALYQSLAVQTDDHAEGVQAFVEKRDASFSGM